MVKLVGDLLDANGTVCITALDFVGIFGCSYLIRQTVKWEMENHRKLSLSCRVYKIDRNSCTNGIVVQGKFSKVFQNLQGIFGPYSARKIVLLCLSLSQFTHKCRAKAGTWDATQLRLKSVAELLLASVEAGFVPL